MFAHLIGGVCSIEQNVLYSSCTVVAFPDEKPTGDLKPPQGDTSTQKQQEVTTPEPVDPDWSSAIMIGQIVLIVIALVLVLAGAIILFLFKSAMSATE